jgi:molybdopterin synthase catalytic subunit
LKIIHITGRSGSGKTTFIEGLIGKLSSFGRVATIKHLGHHNFDLAPGKDTTLFFAKGALVSAGIDSEKSVLIIKQNELSPILDLYERYGIDFVLVEGFKAVNIPGIVMGDLENDHALFRNPTHEEVIQGIERFPDYRKKKRRSRR